MTKPQTEQELDDKIWDALTENVATNGLIGPDEHKQHKNVKALLTASNRDARIDELGNLKVNRQRMISADDVSKRMEELQNG